MTPLVYPLIETVLAEELPAPHGGLMVSVIVPVTERPAPLDWIYREYAPELKSHGGGVEFIFVVERWARELAEALRPLVEEGEPIRVFEAGQGVGESGMLEGARAHARGEVLVTLPAYPRVVPAGVLRLIEAVGAGTVDVASARRDSSRDSWVTRAQRRSFHALLRAGVGGGFRDVASGVRAMRSEVLEAVPVYGDLFRFLPVLAQREGFRVEEISVEPHADDLASRIYSPGIYARRAIDLLGLFFLVRFTRKPLRFFGLIGAVLAGAGAVLLLILLMDRLEGQAIGDRPLLLLAVLLFVTGVQAIAMGLIGEIIVHLSAGRDRPEYRTLPGDR